MTHDRIRLAADFDAAIERVTQALADQGFGVITRIDMHDTFKEKLGVSFPRYTILGACNPKLAHQAVSAAPEIGLLLPCNVTVEEADEGTLVRIPDAREMLGGSGLTEAPDLSELASDAGDRLDRVVAALRDG
ncbi:DUF302 domain-containing protein [Sedimentitalea arenosa]|jgi:uncharacterized protein (DUF302 family)|uniref:DUF302 domain-containing protein n=1 Tax=Sedimentitalea arenosa TaxID=2798803 RepID=A0A8J7J6T9_9RHOB|nr:DUF302 domain-containing protein [Arenibacterium arenosum]MBJ6371347.1 DUF302 domain-containing protein [Arenibacterium arenosum]